MKKHDGISLSILAGLLVCMIFLMVVDSNKQETHNATQLHQMQQVVEVGTIETYTVKSRQEDIVEDILETAKATNKEVVDIKVDTHYKSNNITVTVTLKQN